MKKLSKLLGFISNPRAKIQPESFIGENPGGARKNPRFRDIIKNFPLMFGGTIVLILFLMVLFGPLFAPTNPYITGQSIGPSYDAETKEWIHHPLSPSRENPFGTDQWGNDILSLLLYGARNTLIACAFITMVRIILGLIIGAFAGWNEGSLADRTIMGVISAISAIPLLVSSMILVYALDIRRGLPVFIMALSVLGWTEIAQYIRSEFLVLRKMPFIEGAHAVGARNFEIAVRHVLPNILPQLLIITFFEMGAVLMLLGELSFLGVFIGGGSHIAFGDEIMGSVIQLAEVPEWGTMLAEGYRWLRAKPFIVASPAMAFFISVIGLNSVGEGLRRFIEKHHVSTNFLLRKRMLIVIAMLTFATVFIINNTGPLPWFDKLANAFNGENAFEHVEKITSIHDRAIGQPGIDEAAAYIADNFEQFGLRPGGKQSKYIQPIHVHYVRPKVQPAFSILDANQNTIQSFRHNHDFAYLIEDHGGSGDIQFPLTFVGFESGDIQLSWESFSGLDLRDRIVLLLEGNAPPDFPNEALLRGARGILWIADENIEYLHSQIQLADPNTNYLSKPNIPIFRISTPTAQTILRQSDLNLADLFAARPAVKQTGDGWFTLEINTRVYMSLALNEPVVSTTPSVLGYLQGSDFGVANELVVVVANFDGLGVDPDGTKYPAANHNASGVSILLEIARLWQEQNLDTRRSVLFVAWGSGTLDEPGISSFLQDIDSFRHLPAQSGPRRLSPAIIIQLAGVGAGNEVLRIHPDSSERLKPYIEEKAIELGIPTSTEEAVFSPIPFSAKVPRTQWVYLTWDDSASDHDQDTVDRILPEKLQIIGEIVSNLLIQLVRQVHY